MRKILSRLQSFSFRTRVILTFAVLTTVLVALVARAGYITVRDIYLNQVSDQINLLTSLMSNGIDPRYLKLLKPGERTGLANQHYQEILGNQLRRMHLRQAFLFDADLQVLVQTDTLEQHVSPGPALLLNRRELARLEPGEALVSVPFRGWDDLWYLWGFTRMNENYYLGIQESASRLARVDRLAIMFWGIGISGVLVTILAGWLLARSLAGPVEKLAAFSRELGNRNFTVQAPDGIQGELAVLKSALVSMSQDLSRYHREKEEMLAQIAHELRNPLGGIELLVGLVREDVSAEEAAADYLKSIQGEIQRLKELISSYLNYSRPSPAKPELVNVPELVEEVGTLCTDAIREKQVKLETNFKQRQIRFDPNHLRQILLNLLTNSLEHIKGKGKIEIGLQANGSRHILHVMDNGAGLPAEHVNRLFDPFFSTKKEGTGLGLAICRKLCKENHASIFLTNNPEQGCTATIVVQNEGFEK